MMRSTPQPHEQTEKKSFWGTLYGILDFKPYWFTKISFALLLLWFVFGMCLDESWGRENGPFGKIQLLELLIGGLVAFGAGKVYRGNTKMRRFWFWTVGVWMFVFSLELCWDLSFFPQWSNPVYGLFFLSVFGLFGILIILGLSRNFDLPEILRTVRLPVYDLLVLVLAVILSLWFKINGFSPKTVSLMWGEFGETLVWWTFGTLFFLNSFPPKTERFVPGERSAEIKQYLACHYNIANVQPLFTYGGGSGCAFYTGSLEDRPVFIKWGGSASERNAEFHAIRTLYQCNETNFIRPYFAEGHENIFCISEFVVGTPLDYLIKRKSLTARNKEQILRQFKEIAKTLLKTRILSRDCGAHNFIWTQDERLIMIDFDRAIDTTRCNDWDIIEYPLRRSGVIVGWLKYDDFPTFLTVVKKIGKQPEYAILYDEVYDFIKSHIGSLQVETRFFMVFSIPGLIYFLRNKFFRVLTAFFPLKRWRRRIRKQLYKLVHNDPIFYRKRYRDDEDNRSVNTNSVVELVQHNQQQESTE